MANFMADQDRRTREAMAGEMRELTKRETEQVSGAGNTYTYSYDRNTRQVVDSCHRIDD